MSSRSYREHAIMAFPSFDAASRTWACQANISWISGPNRESAFVRFPKRVTTEAEAVATAVSAAQAWIDKHLTTPAFVFGNEAGSAAPPAKSALKARVLLPQSVKVSKSSAHTFTFEQFKSYVKRYRHGVGERSLQKSYAALVQVHRKRHRSWAEIKPKLRHLGELGTPSRAVKTARLPLTTKDWRRIIRQTQN